MITPDMITNGVVFKHGELTVIIAETEYQSVDYIEIKGNFISVWPEQDLKCMLDWLNRWNATLCPELKLAVVGRES